jgi:uncharacterized surface protein with fasciclin (FAS1) repeats
MGTRTISFSKATVATLCLAVAGTLAVATSVAQPGKDVLSVTQLKGNFITLNKAIEAAGLTSTFTAQGPVTIFAPTDEAFAKLPPAELEALLQPANKDKLVRILTHHVVAGKALETEGMKRSRGAMTAGGDEVKFELVRGRLRVDDARVLGDYNASNGAVIAVDRVLIPN